MNYVGGELVEDAQEFFAPVSSDLISGLMGSYEAMKNRIEELGLAVRQERFEGALNHFIWGNVYNQRHGLPTQIDNLFCLEGAIANLNASYWDKTLKMTDVLDVMPQKRRDEWFEQIKNPLGVKEGGKWKIYPIPDFEEESVRDTLQDLLLSRYKFFAERVDGIFRALSRKHITNQPQGFGKRMIIRNAINSYGTIEHSTSGVINDLRCVIAKFMGRDEPKWGATNDVIRVVRQHNGVWTIIDGGAMRMRIYNGVGTAHLEVHPDMAWRLNAVLASIYPKAIPAHACERPKKTKKIKDFVLFNKPLPFAVIDLLAGMKPAVGRRDTQTFNEPKFFNIPMTLRFADGDHDKTALAVACKVLEALGGVRDKNAWVFDYEPQEVMNEIICSGCIPDHKSHQFYPTPEYLAEKVVELAKIGPSDTCLEPSAGTGNLADLLPKDRTVCIEYSNIHCKVLEAKNHNTLCQDFLKYTTETKFDRVVMNPPFSEGRWKAHVEHAAKMVAANGILVAVLPSSAKNKFVPPGFSTEFVGPFNNEFDGTSVSVVILVATLDKHDVIR